MNINSKSVSSDMSNGSMNMVGSKKILTKPIEDYKLNTDPQPITIKKKSNKRLNYTKLISLKLKPPKAEIPGDITIIKEPDVQIPAASPLVIQKIPKSKVNKQSSIIFTEKPPILTNSKPIAPNNPTIPDRVVSPPQTKVSPMK